MLAIEDVASSGACVKLLEVQRICGKGGEAVSTIIIKVTEVACCNIEAKR